VMADGVIGALNNFARLPIPERKPFEVAVAIQEILELNALPETIKVTIDLPPSLPAVLGDLQQLSIVFTNLIRNARDAMPNGGALKVQSRHLDSFVEIDFMDGGVGIPQENLSRIMEPLFSTKARGIGLGLAISRAIIDKHDGQLRVHSKVGEGSIFTVRLAAAPTGCQVDQNLCIR
jgi:signal transduction histidine kinase